jgi:hypothetical protein
MLGLARAGQISRVLDLGTCPVGVYRMTPQDRVLGPLEALPAPAGASDRDAKEAQPNEIEGLGKQAVLVNGMDLVCMR